MCSSSRKTKRRVPGERVSAGTLLNAIALQDHFTRNLKISALRHISPEPEKLNQELTLAQRYGLCPRPASRIGEVQWRRVHEMALGRGHLLTDCAICRQAFGLEEQVLLSCSHAFHRHCLSNYEKYAKERRCPLCRAPAPQKRSIQDGAIAHRHRCAAAIQAAWRAFCGRRQYIAAVLQLPPPVEHRDRRRWYALQLQERSRRLLKEMHSRQDDVDVLLGELDASLALSRQVFRTPGSEAAMEGEPAAALNVMGSASSSSWVASESDLAAQHAGHTASRMLATNGPICDWNHVISTALLRQDAECAICLTLLAAPHQLAVDQGQSEEEYSTAWLSCSHAFHATCLHAFEVHYPMRAACIFHSPNLEAAFFLRKSCPARQFRTSLSAGSAAKPPVVPAARELLQRNWLFPTPAVKIQQLKISTSRQQQTEIHVVRDDLLHPLVGGNKIRKLDGMLPALKEAGVTHVVTCGGMQSSHTAAVACACAENGMHAHIVIRGEQPSVPTGYHLYARLHGTVEYATRADYANRQKVLQDCAQRLRDSLPSSAKVHIIPEGAANADSLLGFIRLIDYLVQPSVLGRAPLRLVVDSGTGITATGLGLGIKLLQLP
ncbi:hypothetical protein WJX84_007525, partial [Apatococcus fuscideae]